MSQLLEQLSYAEPNELFIYDGQFAYHGERYRGKGWLRWDPESGARIDLTAERTGPAPPVDVEYWHTGWFKPEHYTMIRMRTHGLGWVVAPHVGLARRFDVSLGSYLSVDVRRLIWQDAWPGQIKPGFSGHVTLAFHERTDLFAPLSETVVVGDRKIQERHSAGEGVLAEVDGVEICGRLDSRRRARITWSAPEGTLSRKSAWTFGHALRAAMSLCTGCSAPVLERQIVRTARTYRELRPYREPSRLSGLEWFAPHAGPTGGECLSLALALASNEKLLRMSWGAFSQLLDSQRQRSLESSELLVALILEGILRTLDNRPFVTGKTFNLQEALSRLRPNRFPSITQQQCDHARAARNRLRHPNAHPDWLSSEPRFTHAELTQSSKDMSYLSKFYGRIIFEAVGLPATAHRISL